MGLRKIKNNTPLNPLLIEGTLVGRDVENAEKEFNCCGFRANFVEFLMLGRIKKSPLERGVPVRQLADGDGVCQFNC